jgi:hypothetical protein
MSLLTLHAPFSSISNLLYKSHLPKIIHTAIEVGVFKLLAKGSRSCQDISDALNTHSHITESFLHVLCTIGLLESDNNLFGLTALSQDYLVEQSVLNQIEYIESFSGNHGPFDRLLEGLRHGSTDFKYDMWSNEKAALGMEQMAKAGSVQSILKFVTGIPQFNNCRKMCDLGGNIGYYSFALLEENPNLISHVCDLPQVCQIAKTLKNNHPHFNRICFEEFDLKTNYALRQNFDLFFISHFLYELGGQMKLTEFFSRVNRSMTLGGVFVSNHISDDKLNDDHDITLSLIELQTRLMGYPTHQLPEQVLINALTQAGFGKFNVQKPDESLAFPSLLISAIKIKQL